MDAIDILINSYRKRIEGSQDITLRLTESTRNRLVWFAAIAGFAILNVNVIIGEFNQGIDNLQKVIIIIPLIVAAVLAVIGHLLADYGLIKWMKYYSDKFSEIDLHFASLKNKGADELDWEAVISNVTPGIKELFDKADDGSTLLNRVEISSLVFLVLGFIWALLYPVLFVC